MDLTGLGQGPGTDSRKEGNEISGSRKNCECLDKMSDYQILVEDSSARSYGVSYFASEIQLSLSFFLSVLLDQPISSQSIYLGCQLSGQYKSPSSYGCYILQHTIYQSLLRSNTFFGILTSNTCHLCLMNYISHPYKSTICTGQYSWFIFGWYSNLGRRLAVLTVSSWFQLQTPQNEPLTFIYISHESFLPCSSQIIVHIHNTPHPTP